MVRYIFLFWLKNTNENWKYYFPAKLCKVQKTSKSEIYGKKCVAFPDSMS